MELAKLAKEKDEEKASNCELSNEIEIMKAKEENHMKIVEQHSQDLADLKKALVTCTLWVFFSVFAISVSPVVSQIQLILFEGNICDLCGDIDDMTCGMC